MRSAFSPQSRRCFIALTSSAKATASSSCYHSRRFLCQNSSSTWLGSLVNTQPASHTTRKRRFHASATQAAPKDPYEVLGVAKDASPSDIKKSYFQLARKYHPDSNKEAGAKDKFIEIQQAYDTLSDDKKRSAYDRFGAASQQPGFDPEAFANARGPFGAGGFGGFQDFASAFGSGGGAPQSELFEQLFGAFSGGRSRTQRARGDDIEVSIGISFVDACKGVSRSLNVTPVIDCTRCTGSGLKPGAKRSKCHTCGGTGTRTYVIDSGFQMASTCTSCQGSGSFVPRDAQCGECSGLGKVKVSKSIDVQIPAGVEDGMVIRVPAAGDNPIRGKGPPGDLLVRVNVSPSRIFQRQGVNLLQQVRIPLHTALLGGRVRVPTLNGEVDVKVSPGTQPGEECVLRGRGVPSVMGGSKGDMFVSFQVQIPRVLTRRQRELIELYAEDVNGSPRRADSKDDGGTLKSSPELGNSTQAPSEPGWFSRTWQKSKRLMGV